MGSQAVGRGDGTNPHPSSFILTLTSALILTRYAEEMVRLIDADGSLGLRGADRVIGKEDSTHNQTKSLDVVLGSEEIVLIIDDSPAVTQRHAPSRATPPPPPPPPPRPFH